MKKQNLVTRGSSQNMAILQEFNVIKENFISSFNHNNLATKTLTLYANFHRFLSRYAFSSRIDIFLEMHNWKLNIQFYIRSWHHRSFPIVTEINKLNPKESYLSIYW